jgi:hypothetical protein
LARCCSNCLDLLFFGLLGLPIAFLVAFGHADFSLGLMMTPPFQYRAPFFSE